MQTKSVISSNSSKLDILILEKNSVVSVKDPMYNSNKNYKVNRIYEHKMDKTYGKL